RLQLRYVSLVGVFLFFFFFIVAAPTEIYPLSLHDALPILGVFGGSAPGAMGECGGMAMVVWPLVSKLPVAGGAASLCVNFETKRSEEHTSELQSRSDLVCRLLLEKKKAGLSIRASFCVRMR